MGGYIGSDSRASFELTRDESSLVSTEEEEVTSCTDSPGREYRSIEWTDEKHSLYLKSIEASFVDQLYNSLGFLGSHSKSLNSSKVESSKQMYHGTGAPSDQSKVLRGGCWQRTNLKRPESQLNKRDESCGFRTSPWIKHFSPVSKSHVQTSQSLEGTSASENQAISSYGKKENSMACTTGSATSLKKIHIGRSHLLEQDLIGCGEEVFDQNFVDEEIKDKKASSASSSKKMKIVTNEASSDDQVVPHGNVSAA